ncbi:tRNA N6-adenosine threonylcarbamoyltransferase, mitochondrial [Plutella xylostella]|uniref:tRNA N6-adenosine threonylcarbamoyltransferase, mitochondrial n=1 Tax=Plutella xylostella TaxID=51655 RepID=UPI0020329C50|nr:tRNA N6-adenosine threonylcarbamoyltransferase, mitochondrial [Plutella xylostella]
MYKINRTLTATSSLLLPLSRRYYATILGIETSCDDTGCAIVNGHGQILGEALHSQTLVHLRNGGINPIIARDLHRDSIDSIVGEALAKSQCDISNIDGVAVTVKPGLLASLQIGVKYAKYFSRKYQKPIIPIHHMEAHALVARMYEDIQFPFLVLLISGGHCLLAVAKDVEDFLLLGQSLDDAPGEAFDKVARRMKLRNIPEYSHLAGGRAIELAARKAKDTHSFQLPPPLVRSRDCNFSFSGLKASVGRTIQNLEARHGVVGAQVIPQVHELCASFQLAVTEHLMHRTERAMEFCIKKELIPPDRKNLVISGGVACNDFIFESLKALGNKTQFNVYRPPPPVCTDNGIMIAWNGVEKLRKGLEFTPNFDLKDIEPQCPLGVNISNQVLDANLCVSVTRLKSL